MATVLPTIAFLCTNTAPLAVSEREGEMDEVLGMMY